MVSGEVRSDVPGIGSSLKIPCRSDGFPSYVASSRLPSAQSADWEHLTEDFLAITVCRHRHRWSLQRKRDPLAAASLQVDERAELRRDVRVNNEPEAARNSLPGDERGVEQVAPGPSPVRQVSCGKHARDRNVVRVFVCHEPSLTLQVNLK